MVAEQRQTSDLIANYFGAKIHNSLQLVPLCSTKIIKPANKGKSQNTLNKRITKELKNKNSWIDIKRPELPQ